MEPLVSGCCGKTTSEGLTIPMTTKMTSATDPPAIATHERAGGGQATDNRQRTPKGCLCGEKIVQWI